VCDFYLWGYLKGVVYCAPSPRTTQELKLRIQEEISRIPVDVLRRAMSSVHDRLAECEQRNGGHLEDVIFRVELCVSRPPIHLFLQMLNYVLPYKCNCIMISNPHHRCPYFDVVVGLAWSHDPESYAGGSICYW